MGKNSFFGAMVLYAGVELIITTAVWQREFYAFYLRYMMLYVGLLAGLQFYRFPHIPDDPFIQRGRRELPIVASLLLAAVLGVIGWGIYQWSQLRPTGNPSNQVWTIEFGIALIVGWYNLLLLRKLWASLRSTKPYRLGWKHLPLSQQEPTRILYRISVVALFALVITASMALTTVGLLPQWLRQVIPTVGVLICLFLISITHLATSLAKVSFVMRIVGTTLLVVFLVLGLTGIFVAHTYGNYFALQPLTIPAQTVRFVPEQNGHYWVTTLPPQPNGVLGNVGVGSMVALPFLFRFGGQNWTQVNVSRGGVVAFGEWFEPLYAYNYLPAITVYGEKEIRDELYYFNAGLDWATITWMIPAGQLIQVTLYADGRFDLTYPFLNVPHLQRIGFQTGDGSTDFAPFDLSLNYNNTPTPAGGLLTDYTILHHQTVHQLMIPLVILVLLFSLLSIIGFPILFHITLIKPLQTLVSGVYQVEKGNLNIVVPVAGEDEIGLVTRAFNQMIATLHNMTQIMDAEIKERTKELADSQRQLGALEEREHIGREIHDDLGQVMGYVQMQVKAALTHLQRAEHGQVATILSEVDQVVWEAHSRVRQYILGIRTGKQQGLPIDFWLTLDQHLAIARERYGLEIELDIEPDLPFLLHLTSQAETQLLRIIQEGITNIYKHAQATHVQLCLTIDDQWLNLLLRDNGRGFVATEEPADNNSHFGLKIMQERANSVNGHFYFTSSPGQGSQLRLQVPYVLATTITTNEQTYPWRVLLVDDHILFREGLGNMLKPHGVQIIGTANNGREAESLTQTLHPDLILMDIHMPEQDGLETTYRLKQQFPHLKIVMLTMAEEEKILLKALKYGASGYLLKNLSAPEFLSLLSDVMSGKTIIAPTLANQALTILAQQEHFTANEESAQVTEGPLTGRQQDVLAYLGQGLTNKQIGQRLYISENTVKYHIKQMMDRLHLQTRHELIRYHLENEI